MRNLRKLIRNNFNVEDFDVIRDLCVVSRCRELLLLLWFLVPAVLDSFLEQPVLVFQLLVLLLQNFDLGLVL